jgi:hypothetical protein
MLASIPECTKLAELKWRETSAMREAICRSKMLISIAYIIKLIIAGAAGLFLLAILGAVFMTLARSLGGQASPAYFVKVAVLSAAGLFLLGVLAAMVNTFAKYLIAQASISTPVQIESATISGDDVRSYLPVRAKELGRGVRLEALYEVQVPPLAENFGSSEAGKLPEDLKLEIQGVNVPPIIQSFLTLLPDDRYKISVAKDGQDAVQIAWKPPTGQPQTWLVYPEKSDGTGDAAKKRMIDRVICRVLYHMYYDPEGPQNWRQDPKIAGLLSQIAFPSPRALEAFFVGQQLLATYLHTPEDSEPLNAAELEFRRLEMPEFPDGAMLLGVTLSEKRNEADAILAYDRAKALLKEAIEKNEKESADLQSLVRQNPKLGRKLKAAIEARNAAALKARKTRFQALLFQANAYRKLYRWDELVRAITQLDEIDAELQAIESKPLVGSSATDKLDFMKIRAVALSEKANSIGYGLILLHPDDFIEAFKDKLPSKDKLPASIALKPEVERKLVKAMEQSATPAARKEAFGAILDDLYAKQKKTSDDARAELKQITAQARARTAGGDHENGAWKRENDRIESLLLSAEGYAVFRHAQAPDQNGEVRNDEVFGEECRKALANLQEADARQPDQYVVLQNIGMIYGDPRFDSRNTQIDKARSYFQRSVRLKPNDYFGHQNLASLAVREVYAWGVELADAETIKTAIAEAKDSLKQRPDNGSAFVILAQLYALQWAIVADGSKRANEAMVAAALADAKKVKANAARIRVAELQWGLLQLRAKARDQVQDGKDKSDKFTSAKDDFKKELIKAKSEAADLPGWEAEQLVLTTDDLLKTLESSKVDEIEKKLSWPYSPFPIPHR